MSEAKNVWDVSVKTQENRYYWKGDPKVRMLLDDPDGGYTVAELFSGFGGTSIGFEMAGFQTLLGCDIHIPSIDSFQINHPGSATILGDLTGIDERMVADAIRGIRPDVLIAGVPCQGFSLSNRKRHEKDDRNILYKEFVRFVKALRPRAVVLENVVGMKSTGDFVRDIERDLSDASGTIVRSRVLHAQDYGVPQRRSRLIFVGVEGQTFDFDTVRKTNGPTTGKPYVRVRDAISDLPSLQPKETKTEYESDPQSRYQQLMRIDSDTLCCHVAANHPQSTIDRIRRTKPGEPMYPRFKQRIRLSWDDMCPTLVAGGIRPQPQLAHPSDARGLTIRERCRLQSIPDRFVVAGNLTQGRVQTGNAVPPLLAKAVADAISNYL